MLKLSIRGKVAEKITPDGYICLTDSILSRIRGGGVVHAGAPKDRCLEQSHRHDDVKGCTQFDGSILLTQIYAIPGETMLSNKRVQKEAGEVATTEKVQSGSTYVIFSAYLILMRLWKY